MEKDDIDKALKDGLAEGLYNIDFDPDTGEMRYGLSDKGKARAEAWMKADDANAAYASAIFWNLALADLEKTSNIWRFVRGCIKHANEHPIFILMIDHIAEETKDDILSPDKWRIGLD